MLEMLSLVGKLLLLFLLLYVGDVPIFFQRISACFLIFLGDFLQVYW